MFLIAAYIDHYYHKHKDFENWGKITIFVNAFSPVRNIKRFFKTNEVKDGSNCKIIDSIRILFFFITICVHVFLNGSIALPHTVCESIKF